MTDEQLRNAFEEYNERLCNNLDKNTAEAQTSDKLENRMEKLFKKQKRLYYPFINTAFKRAALTAMAMLCFVVIAVNLFHIPDGQGTDFTGGTEQSGDISFGSVQDSLDGVIGKKSDIFVARVISKEISAETTLYTVEIKESIRFFSVKEDDATEVARLQFRADLEIGKDYLIEGDAQIINNKSVIVDSDELTSEVTKDGRLLPLSKTAELNLDGISTLESLKIRIGQ